MCIGKWFDRRLMWLSYRNHGQRSGRQSGFTLLEALASIGVMGAISVGVFSLANQSVQDTRGSLVAMHMKTVGDAASAYIRKNYVAVQSAASNTVPAVIRIDTLIGDGQLTVGYASQNAEGQTVCVLVLKPSATSNSLNALVVSEGGNVIDDLSLGQIAATIGGAGGGIYAADTTQVKGAMSGWSVPVGNFSNSATKCNGTTGKVTLAKGHPAMALWFSDGSSVSATLYRDAVPGNPSLNTMNTPIIMSASTNQLEGGACTTDGAISRTSSGAVVSCTKDAAGVATWQPSGSAYWRDAVDNFASLPTTTDKVGAVRVTKDTGRAFVWNGTSWAAIAVDQNGNLKVPGTVTANAADVSGAVTAGAVIVQGIDPATGLVKKVTIGGGSTPGSVYADSGIFANPNAAGVGLGITGTANFGSDVNVNGQTNLQTLNAGQTTLRGYVDMYQSAQIRGGLSVSNNIAANGMISTDGDIVAHGTAKINGYIWTGSDLSVTRDLNVGQNASLNGTFFSNGRMSTNEYIQINGTATAGAWCPSNGLVAQDGSGKLLSCQSNVWKSALTGQWRIQDGAPCYVDYGFGVVGLVPSGSRPSISDTRTCVGGELLYTIAPGDPGGGGGQ